MKFQNNRHGLPGEAGESREHLIQKRAYELYLKRGKKPGHELEDWLQAEREVRAMAEHEHQQHAA